MTKQMARMSLRSWLRFLCLAVVLAGTPAMPLHAQEVPSPAAPEMDDPDAVIAPDREAMTTPAVTPEPAGAAHEGEAGLPQLNPANFAPQLAWLAVTFVALYLLMSRLALPRIAEVLEERQERIADDLDKAQALKQETEQVIAAYEKSLEEARARARAVMAETTAQIQAATAAENQRLEQRITAELQDAETRIAQARAQTMMHVKDMANDIVRQTTAKVAGIELDADTVDRVTSTILRENG